MYSVTAKHLPNGTLQKMLGSLSRPNGKKNMLYKEAFSLIKYGKKGTVTSNQRHCYVHLYLQCKPSMIKEI